MGLVRYFGAENRAARLIDLAWFGCNGLVSADASIKDESMPNNSESNIATADALTLLLHNQHALGAAIEEVTRWLSENEAVTASENAVMAMKTLDTNAKALTDAITRLRRS
jgi:hypothetical protein